MSGGHFDYIQWQLTEVAQSVKDIIEQSGAPLTEEELAEKARWFPEGHFDAHPEEKFHDAYSEEVLEELKRGYEIIKKASVYINSIDKLICSDYGEETFLENLKRDLEDL